MIKNCRVLLNNDAVTVVKYGDVDVQLPSIRMDAQTVFVKYADGKYSVVSGNTVLEDSRPKEAQKDAAKKATKKKKTTAIESATLGNQDEDA